MLHIPAVFHQFLCILPGHFCQPPAHSLDSSRVLGLTSTGYLCSLFSVWRPTKSQLSIGVPRLTGKWFPCMIIFYSTSVYGDAFSFVNGLTCVVFQSGRVYFYFVMFHFTRECELQGRITALVYEATLTRILHYDNFEW